MKTAAERQAAYRQKHLKDVDGTKARLNVILDHQAKTALARLAKHQNAPQADVLARLILDEERRLIQTLPAEEQNAYYDAVTA